MIQSIQLLSVLNKSGEVLVHSHVKKSTRQLVLSYRVIQKTGFSGIDNAVSVFVDIRHTTAVVDDGKVLICFQQLFRRPVYLRPVRGIAPGADKVVTSKDQILIGRLNDVIITSSCRRRPIQFERDIESAT